MAKSDLAVFWHPDVLKHDAGRGCFESAASPLMDVAEPHPETAERIVNIRSILKRGAIADRLEWRDGRHATRDEIARFHVAAYIDEVIAAETNAPVRIDGSGTVINTGTVDAAFAAAGTTIAALESILVHEHPVAYALVRPPGHHAARHMADGNCIFNNLAIAVETALASGCGKVAVIDWDVHHGNGTQSGFYDHADVLTISMHMPLGSWGDNHPETGTIDELGVGDGRGFNLNIPLPYGSGDRAYANVMNRLVRPAVSKFEPDLLMVACGQDANQFDPNGRNLLSMAGFRELGRAVRELATELCNGRLLLCQEGGYAITYTGFCMYAVAEGLLDVETPMADPLAYDATTEQPEAAFEAVARIEEHWKELATGGRTDFPV
ncbi:MAG: class II histone deacetylase, partial [Gammaproteobacteria bacterium]|nr:class II histone deacetylase [Gammaproteobacteria bacterium]